MTISSDEEEEGKSRKSEGSNNSSFLHDANTTFSEEMETILEKEPVITNNSVPSPRSDYAMESEDMKGMLQKLLNLYSLIFMCTIWRIMKYTLTLRKESGIKYFSDNSIQSPHTSVLCRTVRIGSYKYFPRERVVISQTGVRLSVPLLEDGKFILLILRTKENNKRQCTYINISTRCR